MPNIVENHAKRRRPYPTPDPETAPIFLNMRQVRARTGLGEMTIRRMVEMGRFPRPVRLTQQRVAWRVADLAEWECSRREVA